MRYARMPIEIESPEELGYSRIRYNLSESSISDMAVAALNLTLPNVTLLYGEHRGSERLRSLIVGQERTLSAADVIITSGAAGALFIVATALLDRGDHLVVVRPNYATNLETPRAIGCDVTHVDLRFEAGFRLDFAAIEAAITPQTRLISVTYPHNPTGVMCTEQELLKLTALARARGCRLLVDETYRDLSFDGALPLAATLGTHVISVSSLSKAFGAPGIRVGWLITRDSEFHEKCLAAKEQISICGSVLDEWVAERILERRESLLEHTLTEMRLRRGLVRDWIAGEVLLEWVEPQGGVVCFPRMRAEPAGGTDAFYRRHLFSVGLRLADTGGAGTRP
jgi:aspartate/methionine/tyrosine aminotransferase